MKITKKLLPNKIPLLFIDLPDATSSSFLVFYRTGARLDKSEKSGAAHLLEHSIFKGSSKFKSAFDISFAFESIGSQIDAGTSMEYTYYMVKALPDKLLQSMEILSDILLTATLPKNEIEKEKLVVCEEIKMYRDNPIIRVSKLFMSELWQGDALGKYIAGTVESVTNLSKKDLEQFKSAHYCAGNLILAVAGKLNDVKLIEKSLNEIWSSLEHKGAAKFDAVKKRDLKGQVITEKSNLEQVHLVCGEYAPGLNSDERYPFSVGATIIGQGMGSRLFTKLREENPLCYYVNAGYLGFTDTGAFAVKAGLNKENLDFAREIIRNEIVSVSSGNFSDEEFARAKAVLLSSLTFDLEGADDLSVYYATSEMLLEKQLSPDDLRKIVDSIDKNAVVAALTNHLNPERMLTAMIGV